jgi:hypothetical protein
VGWGFRKGRRGWGWWVSVFLRLGDNHFFFEWGVGNEEGDTCACIAHMQSVKTRVVGHEERTLLGYM